MFGVSIKFIKLMISSSKQTDIEENKNFNIIETHPVFENVRA